MTRRSLTTLAISTLLLIPMAPAHAYRGDERSRCGSGYDSGDSYGCDDYGGQGNRNRQDRHQGRDDNHKSFSPDLKDSPVTICLPQSTCNFDGNGRKKDDQGGDGQGQEPS